MSPPAPWRLTSRMQPPGQRILPRFLNFLSLEREDNNVTHSINAILPPILSLFHLQRIKASIIHDAPLFSNPDSGFGDVRIGMEIPPVHWMTVELGMKAFQLHKYTQAHHHLVAMLGKSYEAMGMFVLETSYYLYKLILLSRNH